MMMKRSFVFRALSLLLFLVLSVPALALAEEGETEREMPPAFARHLEKLQKTVQGVGGEAEDGRASAAEEAFLQRAYPDDTLSVEQMDAARAAFTKIQGRPFPTGKGRPGTWVSVGPREALYPATPFRSSFSYIPNDYVAGGRTTALAISDTCKPGDCRLWVTPAGGGIWRTKNALDGQPHWEYLAGPLGINAAGSVTIDRNDPTGNTIYVGTGEANICGSGCVAGVGLYKSTDGGDTWTGPLGKNELSGKGIGAIVVKPGDPNTIYVGTTTALHGLSSVCCGGVTRPVPGAAQWGLYKSTDGGATWTFIHNGAASAALCTGTLTEYQNLGVCSPRGVRHVALDPSDPETVYAGSYARGVWRSKDGGASWTQIKTSLNTASVSTRPAFAVTALPNGKTRMYVYEGSTGNPYARLFRSDDVAAGAPVFQDLTSNSIANIGFGTFNLCTGQCSYDLSVHTPKGYPDMVYVVGSYSYNEAGRTSNGRAVVLSTDAGVSATDMTMDGTDSLHPNGLHPDQHSIVTNPNNPFQFFETSDGGIMRSSGEFSDVSSWCDSRNIVEPRMSRCKQLLSRVPSKLESLNKGLATLQFQSLSVSPHNVNIVQGGTQDNGTWQSTGNPVKWENTMIGDGGQSGFDAGDPDFRFHTFFDASPDVNFSKGDIADWNWIGDPIFGTGGQFYSPIISDPVVSKTMFAGTANAWRTKTWGMGTMTLAEFRQHCNEWFGDFTVICGDWVQIASPSLNSAVRGTRAGGSVAAFERTTGDTSTAWVGNSTGRVFVSKNVDAEPASAVTFTRIDTAAQPGRYVTGIYIDPANPNRAWISYSGFNISTPTTPGHVFEVVYNPGSGTATWTDVSYDLGDLPINDVVRDDVTGDLYVSSDFGVSRLAVGTSSWTLAAPGMPNVEVAGLTIIPSERKMYAATHGLSAWLLNLP
jgi:hypothetical protein